MELKMNKICKYHFLEKERQMGFLVKTTQRILIQANNNLIITRF